MGACGCADNSPTEIYRLGKGKYLGVSAYKGCDYCDTGIGFDIVFLNAQGRKDWADRVPVQRIEFERDSSSRSSLMLGCVGLNELREAAKNLCSQQRMASKFTGFRSVDEWLEEHGLELLQEAFRVHLREVEENKKSAAKAVPREREA